MEYLALRKKKQKSPYDYLISCHFLVEFAHFHSIQTFIAMPRFKFDPNKGRPILVMVMTQELDGPTVVHPGMNHLMGMVDILCKFI